ncbi:probable serine/threonine-protein kinase DDB_G0271538 [Artemia franciscana]|uniref:probable serine/threonine-protein kinase DDB_G0271538 n=1 Tax=Artemia franciscana TaxID=6661 RepID=UPI0032DA333D
MSSHNTNILIESDFSNVVRTNPGVYVSVYKASYKGKDVAIKVFRGHDREAFEKEVELLEGLKDKYVKNIVKYLGSVSLSSIGQGEQHVFEYCPFTVKKRLESNEQLSHSKCVAIARDIASGMSCLHEANIILRNLSSANVLLKANETAVVSNLRLACVMPNREKKGKFGIVKDFPRTAPEIVAGEEYDQSSDVYSFGVILIELICHKPLENLKLFYTPRKSIDSEKFKSSIPDEKNLKDLYDIAAKCLSFDPKKRPTFKSLIIELGWIFDCIGEKDKVANIKSMFEAKGK